MSGDTPVLVANPASAQDMAAAMRIYRRSLWRDGSWIGSSLIFAVSFALVGTAAYAGGSVATDQQILTDGLVCACIQSYLAGAVWMFFAAEIQAKKALLKFVESQWECQLTEDAYVYRDKQGISMSLPWSILKIEMESPDAWMIKYGKRRFVVFRRPLREACLEEEFLSRLKQVA